MFDLRYQLRLNDLYDLTATNVLYYEMVQQHIRLLDNILAESRQPIRFNQHMNRLYLDMDVDMINANEFLIIECYRKLDPTDFTDIYNDMLKKYATAKCKYQWVKTYLSFKYHSYSVTLRCQQLKQETQEEIQRLEEESRLNHDMLPIYDMIDNDMPTNVFFNHAVSTEQQLYEDLVVESLSMYGHNVFYLPREVVEEDSILNEDVQSKYRDSYQVEMYIENTDGFEGGGSLMSKFYSNQRSNGHSLYL